MSDEPKKRSRGKWPNWPAYVCAIAVIAAYQGAHYATARYTFCGGVWFFEEHAIGYEPVPWWVERLLEPAQRIDEIIGLNPWSWR
jgi:hypothetical protein